MHDHIRVFWLVFLGAPLLVLLLLVLVADLSLEDSIKLGRSLVHVVLVKPSFFLMFQYNK